MHNNDPDPFPDWNRIPWLFCDLEEISFCNIFPDSRNPAALHSVISNKKILTEIRNFTIKPITVFTIFYLEHIHTPLTMYYIGPLLYDVVKFLYYLVTVSLRIVLVTIGNVLVPLYSQIRYAPSHIVLHPLHFIWATPWENVSSGVSDQARHKLTCSATEIS